MAAHTLPFSLRPLESNLVGPKPREKAPDDLVKELEAKNRLIIERKHNGHCTFIPITGLKNRVGIYSRSIQDWTKKFPRITEELRAMNIPRDTLLVGEMTLVKDGVDSPSEFSRLSLSKPKRARELQKIMSPPKLSVFNVIIHKGKLVTSLPYEDRLSIIYEIARRGEENVGLVELVDLPFYDATALSIKNKWEGLVLYDASASTELRLDGKHEQTPKPNGCWKWKDYIEGDFVATGWIPSTSKTFKGLVRDLEIAQYDPHSGELIPWGRVGVGLTTKQKKLFTDKALYPFVIEIQFERRTPNKRLISGRILRIRDDKRPEECFSPS